MYDTFSLDKYANMPNFHSYMVVRRNVTVGDWECVISFKLFHILHTPLQEGKRFRHILENILGISSIPRTFQHCHSLFCFIFPVPRMASYFKFNLDEIKGEWYSAYNICYMLLIRLMRCFYFDFDAESYKMSS